MHRMMAQSITVSINEEFTTYVYEDDIIDNVSIKCEPDNPEIIVIDDDDDVEVKPEPEDDPSVVYYLDDNDYNTSWQDEEPLEEKFEVEETEVKWFVDEHQLDHAQTSQTKTCDQEKVSEVLDIQEAPAFRRDSLQSQLSNHINEHPAQNSNFGFREELLVNWSNLKSKISQHPERNESGPTLDETARRNLNRLLIKSEVESMRRAQMEENQIGHKRSAEHLDDANAKVFRAKVVKIVNSPEKPHQKRQLLEQEIDELEEVEAMADLPMKLLKMSNEEFTANAELIEVPGISKLTQKTPQSIRGAIPVTGESPASTREPHLTSAMLKSIFDPSAVVSSTGKVASGAAVETVPCTVQQILDSNRKVVGPSKSASKGTPAKSHDKKANPKTKPADSKRVTTSEKSGVADLVIHETTSSTKAKGKSSISTVGRKGSTFKNSAISSEKAQGSTKESKSASVGLKARMPNSFVKKEPVVSSDTAQKTPHGSTKQASTEKKQHSSAIASEKSATGKSSDAQRQSRSKEAKSTADFVRPQITTAFTGKVGSSLEKPSAPKGTTGKRDITWIDKIQTLPSSAVTETADIPRGSPEILGLPNAEEAKSTSVDLRSKISNNFTSKARLSLKKQPPPKSTTSGSSVKGVITSIDRSQTLPTSATTERAAAPHEPLPNAKESNCTSVVIRPRTQHILAGKRRVSSSEKMNHLGYPNARKSNSASVVLSTYYRKATGSATAGRAGTPQESVELCASSNTKEMKSTSVLRQRNLNNLIGQVRVISSEKLCPGKSTSAPPIRAVASAPATTGGPERPGDSIRCLGSPNGNESTSIVVRSSIPREQPKQNNLDAPNANKTWTTQPLLPPQSGIGLKQVASTMPVNNKAVYQPPKPLKTNVLSEERQVYVGMTTRSKSLQTSTKPIGQTVGAVTRGLKRKCTSEEYVKKAKPLPVSLSTPGAVTYQVPSKKLAAYLRPPLTQVPARKPPPAMHPSSPRKLPVSVRVVRTNNWVRTHFAKRQERR